MYTPIRDVELILESKPTFVATQVGGAHGVRALDGVSAVHWSGHVGACVVRAERFTALLFFALVAIALHVLGFLERSVAVGAADGVAVRRVYMAVGVNTRSPKRVYMAVGVNTRSPKRNDKQLRKHGLGVVRNWTLWIARLQGIERVS